MSVIDYKVILKIDGEVIFKNDNNVIKDYIIKDNINEIIKYLQDDNNIVNIHYKGCPEKFIDMYSRMTNVGKVDFYKVF